MSGWLALSAEVLACVHQPAPENTQPDLVDSHACRQWVVLVKQPFGQRKTIKPSAGFDSMQHCGNARRYRLSVIQERAPVLAKRFSRFWQFLHHQRSSAVALLERLELGLQSSMLFPGRGQLGC